MKRKAVLITLLLVVVILITAAFTKPSDKNIMIDVVNALWGNKVPDKSMPQYYEQFMNLTTKDIEIDDWLFLKRIRYTLKDTTSTIGYAAFGKVMLNK